MAYRLTWLADALRAAGCRVVECDGWKERGHGDMLNVVGVLCHHTAGPRTGDAPSLVVVKSGRPGWTGRWRNCSARAPGVVHRIDTLTSMEDLHKGDR